MDVGLQALAKRGCGESLKTLHFERLVSPNTMHHCPLAAFLRRGQTTVLHVTVASFQALAEAGCGKKLAVVFLEGE